VPAIGTSSPKVWLVHSITDATSSSAEHVSSVVTGRSGGPSQAGQPFMLLRSTTEKWAISVCHSSVPAA
jgi:hypothetical protein